jgi:hypothetical protein
MISLKHCNEPVVFALCPLMGLLCMNPINCCYTCSDNIRCWDHCEDIVSCVE